MHSDGSELEALVSFVEGHFLPEGLTIRTREKVFDGAVQIAEFDVVVTGKVGTTDFSWLIECRDRPSEGAAPASWIEQLVGRRARFKFNKVTAVSTAGFSEGAKKYAADEGIETREVKSLEIDAFKNWIAMTHMTQILTNCELTGATIDFSTEDVEAHGQELRQVLAEAKATKENFLRLSKNGEFIGIANAFRSAVQQQAQFIEALEANGPGKSVALTVTYTNDDDHFVVHVDSEPIRVRRIRFRGVLTKTELMLPVAKALEYRGEDSRTISQLVAFQPMKVAGVDLSLEFHRMPDLEQAFVLLKASKASGGD